MFLKLFGRSVEAAASSVHSTLVVTMPPHARAEWSRRSQAVGTFDAVSELLAGAATTVRVFSPYVDPTFTSLLHRVAPRVSVRIVTTSRDGRCGGPNPVLERCSLDRPMEVRYVVEHRNKAQMFQMHAKLVCVDGRVAYVGSANLTDTSIHYNLELGLLTCDPHEVAALESLFAFVWDTLAMPARRLWGGRGP